MDYLGFLITGISWIVRTFFSLWWIWLPWYLWRLALGTQHYSLIVAYLRRTQWVLLEIKLPREVMQTPESMDRVFAALHGPHDPPRTFKDKYIELKIRLWWNFEIQLSQGDVKFYAYIPKPWRTTFEASIYAQYPTVMISEAVDYTRELPEEIPGPEYDIWGMEMKFWKEEHAHPLHAYPILTYRDFKTLSDPGIDVEEVKVDPLSSLAEISNQLLPGEHVWYQILARPVGRPAQGGTDSWVEQGDAIVDKLIAREKPKAPSRWAWVSEIVTALMEEIPEHLSELMKPGSSNPEAGLGRLGAPAPKQEQKQNPTLMMHLTPGEKEIVEAIQHKTSKLGFDCVLRILYIAPRGQLDRGKISTLFSLFRQYNTWNLNGFRQNTQAMTLGHDYFGGLYTSRKHTEEIKHGLVYWYRHRSIFWNNKNVLSFLFIPDTAAISHIISGLLWRLFPMQIEGMRSVPIVLNTEELATLFHFPGRTVSSPTMTRMEAKQGQPPVNLPTD